MREREVRRQTQTSRSSLWLWNKLWTFPPPPFFFFFSGTARKSRWGDKTGAPGQPQSVEGRSPELVAYAMQVFGSADLEPHQWKQCEDQMKVRGGLA